MKENHVGKILERVVRYRNWAFYCEQTVLVLSICFVVHMQRQCCLLS